MHIRERFADNAPAAAPPPGSRCRSILVGLGPARRESRTLAVAAALAQREGARLTVLATVIPPPFLIWGTPIALPYDPARAAEEECDTRLRAAVADLPADLSVTTLLRRAAAPDALLAELATEQHDLVVVGGGRRRWTRRPASRMTRALLGRSRVPVLVVNAVRVAERAPAARAQTPGVAFIQPAR